MQHRVLPDAEGPERLDTRDIEKGQTPSVETQDCMSPDSEDGLIVQDYRTRSEANNNG
jgi:DNA-directed RNA polymerase subunit H (RpoH/RPB5)